MMKRTLTIVTSLFIVLMLSSFAFRNPPVADATGTPEYKIMEVAYLWELMKQGYTPNWEEDRTWLDVGLRAKYAMAKKYASLEILEATFGTKVFFRGPHDGEMNFNSNTSFGYYNPVFIESVKTSLKDAMLNPIYKEALARVYRSHLKDMASTYLDAYRYVNRDQTTLAKQKAQYLMDMARPDGTTRGSFQEVFWDYAQTLQREKGADLFEASTAPAFWMRRSIDGTDRAFYDLLEMVDRELK